MERQTGNDTISPLGSREKHELLVILDSLFPDQDLLNENSKHRKKVDLTFNLMQRQKWTTEEFEKTLLEFSLRWSYTSWMPANLFELKKRLFSDNEIVI